MGVFSRFTDIINANINSLLEKAEQPDKMIKLIIQEMEETTVELRSTTAQYIAEKKSLMRQIRQLDNEIEHWQQKAELALSKNREDLAKLAIQAKHKALKQLNELTEQQSSIEKHLDDLQRDNQSLQQKLSEAKNKQQAYIIRQQSAQTRLKMREKSEQYDVEAAIYKFECYQQKIEQLESQIEAFDFTDKTDLHSQFSSLQQESDIEQELSELKAQVKVAQAS